MTGVIWPSLMPDTFKYKPVDEDQFPMIVYKNEAIVVMSPEI